jgi:hypothetical protein
MELYAGVDYNLTLCPLQKSNQANLCTMDIGQPYARVDIIPEFRDLDLVGIWKEKEQQRRSSLDVGRQP